MASAQGQTSRSSLHLSLSFLDAGSEAVQALLRTNDWQVYHQSCCPWLLAVMGFYWFRSLLQVFSLNSVFKSCSTARVWQSSVVQCHWKSAPWHCYRVTCQDVRFGLTLPWNYMNFLPWATILCSNQALTNLFCWKEYWEGWERWAKQIALLSSLIDRR